MEIKIIKLTDKKSKYFNTICDWQISWWAKEYDKEKVVDFMVHCLNDDKIPQTYIALLDDEVVGMYQITMYDNVDVRPDYYPWLVNVYVAEDHRNKGICNILMKDAVNKFESLGFERVYLHTKHKNLYEKYGWLFVEKVVDFDGKERRIFYLDINKDKKRRH